MATTTWARKFFVNGCAKARYGDYPALARDAPPRQAEIQVFRVGAVAFAGLPGEPILEVGRATQQGIKAQGFEHSLVLGVANDYIGYIVNEKEYAHRATKWSVIVTAVRGWVLSSPGKSRARQRVGLKA